MVRNIMLSQPLSSAASSASPASPPVLQHVADNVRRLRTEAGLSQGALAEQAGLSRRMINGLEAGSANISLSSLDAIAGALGVTFVDLVRAPRGDNRDIQETVWQEAGGASRAVLLGAAPAGNVVELWSWVLAPGASYAANADMAGFSEMIVVTEGQLAIVFDHEVKRLAAGEFAIYSSAQRYRYCNEGEAVVRFVRNVVS